MKISTILQRTVIISIAALLFSGLFAPSSHALVAGQLHSTAQLQKYSGSIRSGLEDFTALLSPIQTPSGNLRFIAMKNDDSYHLVTLSLQGNLLKSTPISSDVSTYQLAVDSHGAVYIGFVTNGISHLLRYNQDHVVTLDITTPVGTVAVDTHDTIYTTASDQGYTVIKRFSQNGDLISTSSPLQLNGENPIVSSLNIASNGNILATVSTEEENAIVELNNNGSIVRVLVDTLPNNPLYSLSVDGIGNLYIALLKDNPTGPEQCGNMDIEVHKYNKDGTHIGILDTSSEVSDGPVCALYGAGAANTTIPVTTTQSGDLFIGSGDYSGATIDARIVKYSYPNTTATFTKNSHTAEAKLTLDDSAELVEATTNTLTDIGAPVDANYHYPLGMIHFRAKVSTANSVAVELLFVTELSPDEVKPRKYHTLTEQYGDVPSATVTQSELNGKPALKLSYSITDNGELDEDKTPGVIVDPIGLAVITTDNAIGAPNTGYARQAHFIDKFPVISLVGITAIVVGSLLYKTTTTRKHTNIQSKRR